MSFMKSNSSGSSSSNGSRGASVFFSCGQADKGKGGAEVRKREKEKKETTKKHLSFFVLFRLAANFQIFIFFLSIYKAEGDAWPRN